ncbi:EamA family transporter [Modestobacter sp. VKM Ac-2979]|uniref:EamA family transporter n=1 Tax=unclassified Modestobacter TaxID=2643866 RepID=UPI0022AB7E3F|nr:MULTISPECIES: EamA family transporter [unclassified Modestobacter]MCZ2814352.1 EamA family transporter [Modestobacter sp. VKM Ac-2979]MCZ2843956.1 EamA family transporter [Modestobacter sp. VKM Ac-2980]
MSSAQQIDQAAADQRAGGLPGLPSGAGVGVALMLSSALANQVGAAVGALAFPVIGAVGVVAVRQWVAGIVLVGVVRPRPWRLTAAQWRPVLLLAVVFATMNLSLYAAIERIGLGLAVTLEFLGPLGVALAASRRRRDLVCALVALAGVVALSRPQPTTDHTGIALGLLAAACWAGYILVNRQLGARVPGGTGPATAAGLSALLFLPVGIVVLVAHPPSLVVAGYAVTAGVLASAVPLFVDLLALRRVPAGAYGVFMSIHPVIATVVGLVVLGQGQPWDAWLAIAAIVGANVAGQLPARRPAG